MAVSVFLKGRLGNQCMQLLTMLAYGLKHDLQCCIPEHTMNNSIWPPYFKRLSTPLPDNPTGYIELIEQKHSYQELEFREEWRNHLIMLSGYFQSYKYFDEYKKELRQMMGFNLSKKNNVVGLHIRRGDYLNYPDKHPVVTVEYLSLAISEFKDALCFHVFSDDIDWCISNLPDLFHKNTPGVGFIWNFETDPAIAIQQYIHCEHHIISNSTWSWIGAYFGIGKVVTPHEDNWFGPGNSHLETKDIIPPNWIRIKY